MNANQIIRRPLVTEKSTMLRESGANVIAFEVAPGANKIQVKQAVEELFKVKVEEVRLFNVRGKMKRMGRYEGKRRDWRKAYVRLQEGQKAPDFSLPGPGNKPVKLTELTAKGPVVLYTFIQAFTGP